ncbi:CapA family protein [Syntrophus buswellii]|uniref:CapA family protein n=1 Tax=Syntrophus buswellii TaxID=43774 RepID=UPI0038D3B0E6
MITVVIGGDIYPSGNIQKPFIDGNAEEIFHDLLDDITSADLSVVNLEAPIVSKETPIKKPGGTLGAPINTINGFIAARWNVLNLANNHSFDQGVQGLLETFRTIKKAGLSYVGAGANIEEAQKPFIKEINGERIIIYSMAEREFSVADENMPGANPLDIINFLDAVQKYKKNGIFIALVHGGKEYYPYPTPEMVRRCRFMVDAGADAVVCCHTHCPLPWEIYANRPIIYGLGNLVFEPLHETLSSWHEGYLARLTVENRRVHFEPIPYLQSKAITGVRKMDDTSRQSFLDDMEKKNIQIKDSIFLKDQWVQYCRQQKDSYFSMLFGYNKIMSKLRHLLLHFLHSKDERQRALLLVQCETHQEILNTIFKDERVTR